MASASSTFDGSENPLSEAGLWTSGPGSYGDCQKVGGRARATASAQDDAARLVTPPIGDIQFSEATSFYSNVGASRWTGVMTRMPSATEADSYIWAGSHSLGNHQVFRCDDPGFVFTQLGATIAVAPVSGDVLRMESNGSTHSVFINGVLQTTRTDATYTSGQPAIEFYATTVSDAELDNWSGGDLASDELISSRLLLSVP